MNSKSSNYSRQIILPGVLALGDVLSAFCGLSVGYWIRYVSPIKGIAVEVEDASYGMYFPLLCVGVALLLITYSYLNLYDQRLLLRKLKSLGLIIKGTTFWFFAYLGISLVLKFDPPISRLFVVIAYSTTLLYVYGWRVVFYEIVTKTKLHKRLQLRVAILGYTEKADDFVKEVSPSSLHPFGLVGFIDDKQGYPESWESLRLGDSQHLESILVDHDIDVLLAANLGMPRDELVRVTEVCERNYIEWKVIPSVFDVFISNLRLQTFGSVPVLGVEHFAILRFFSRVSKRVFDIVFSLIGLIVATPVMAVLSFLIRWESPGKAIFSQERVGTKHRTFVMYKLRSMANSTGNEDDKNQSTQSNDPRLLKVGRFMRKWNLDELPQFINVLKGEMSLVGPRPERPYHVDKLSETIPHYMPRHLVKPGMSGWAQVNKLRGDSSLEKRIQYDIYYIENWSLLFDFQIVLLTFLRWKDPAS